MTKKITLIGAGLAGCLLALYLAKRGYRIALFEARSDPRVEQSNEGRSINLALSCRGLTALACIGLIPQVRKIMVPMRARAIHQQEGNIKCQPFGRHNDESIYAIQRIQLNSLLLTEIEKNPRIKLKFNSTLVYLEENSHQIYFTDKQGKKFCKNYEILIGADGAASELRDQLVKKKRIKAARQFLPEGYKELTISQSYCGSLIPEHLHLWPRTSHMLLGNPNTNGSVTGTLFLPKFGPISFASLQNESLLMKFFRTSFPDIVPRMPNLPGEFFNHPIGSLSNICCTPWYVGQHCLLLGYAAHGMAPFFGQGMNSAFEDCRILNELLDFYQDCWEQVIPAFYSKRKTDIDAVIEMSMDNYEEICHRIRDQQFNYKKFLDQELMHRYPGRYISKHVLVMFSNIPYENARKCGELQNNLLEEISKKWNNFTEIDWSKVDQIVIKYYKKLSDYYLMN